ncbi:Katanin p80 WD40 repeat-containing subunit B1, partial [Desmophyllum pertusum]
MKEEQSAIPEESANKEGEALGTYSPVIKPEDFKTDIRTPPRQKHEPFQPPLEDPLSQGPVKQAPVVKPSAIVPEPVKPTKPTSVNDKPANKQKDMIPSERDKPAGLQLSDFLFLPELPMVLMRRMPIMNRTFDQKNPAMSEKELSLHSQKVTKSIAAIMTSRLKNLSGCSRFWGDGDIK